MLELRHISKAFGTNLANNDVSFGIESGQILALVGENGAGKSTLLRILAGFLEPDAGEILIDGQQCSFGSPGDSIRSGIGLVHQHLSLIPAFTVLEQLELAGWKGKQLPALLGRNISGSDVVGQLSLGQQQRLEIAKVLGEQPASPAAG